MGLIKSALSRVISWHAKGRRFGSRTFYNLSFGYLWAYNNIDFDMETNGETALIAHLFDAPPEVVFDVGANVGNWSLRVLHHHTAAQIHAFEIAPAVHVELKGRLKGTSIVVNDFGLSDRTETLKIKYYPGRNELSSIHLGATHFPWAYEIIDAQVLTGSEYCTQKEISYIDLLKIDTEGHDISVLRGFSDLIEHEKISIIQFEHNETAIYSRTFLKDFYELLGAKYVIGRILPMGVAFKDYSTLDENFLHANYLAVARSRPEIIRRLKVAA
jgi:FkbM family methyltransferase